MVFRKYVSLPALFVICTVNTQPEQLPVQLIGLSDENEEI